MELKRILKLKKSGGIAKKSDFPNSFSELKEKAKEFVPINEGIQKYQFIEENANREIRHQEDFDLMNKEYEKEKIIKISVNVIDKPLDEQNLSFSNVSCKKSEEEVISINNNIDLGDIKIEEPEEKMKREIQEIVNNKMKNLEERIAHNDSKFFSFFIFLKSSLIINKIDKASIIVFFILFIKFSFISIISSSN